MSLTGHCSTPQEQWWFILSNGEGSSWLGLRPQASRASWMIWCWFSWFLSVFLFLGECLLGVCQWVDDAWCLNMFQSNQRVKWALAVPVTSCRVLRVAPWQKNWGKRSIGCFSCHYPFTTGAAVGSGPWGTSFRVQPNLDCGGRGGVVLGWWSQLTIIDSWL